MKKLIIFIMILSLYITACGKMETPPVVDNSSESIETEETDTGISLYKAAEENEKTADTDEYEDIYGIAERVGNIGAVIKRIDTLGTESGASKCTIYYSTLEDEEYEDELGVYQGFIISLDDDYYVISYYLGEGAVSTLDKTGLIEADYGE